MKDHDAHEWVAPETLLNWKLAPADIPIAKAVIELKTTKHTTSKCSQRANARDWPLTFKSKYSPLCIKKSAFIQRYW